MQADNLMEKSAVEAPCIMTPESISAYIQVEYPATRLLTGNTLSCGCLKGEHFKAVNKYFEGTSLRQAIEGQVHSTRAMSGYPGVHRNRDRWAAKITYPKVTYQLGTFENIDGAIAARQEAERLLLADPQQFQEKYRK